MNYLPLKKHTRTLRMISLCTVILEGMDEVLDTMIDSLLKRTKLITEVIIVKVDEDSSEKRWEERGITFRKFGYLLDESRLLYGHALGLHECINRATNEHIIISDPDIFYCTNVDEIYVDLMEKYNLNIVGTSHHAAINQSYTFFPCVMNMMVKKSELPSEEFLKGHLRIRPTILRAIPPNYEPDEKSLTLVDGKYLMIGPIPEYIDEFPNKNIRCHFDIGCNLWLWASQQNWKWLAFQTLDCHYYFSTHYRSNVKSVKVPSRQKLLYHYTSGYLNCPDVNGFLDEYKALEKEESEDIDD